MRGLFCAALALGLVGGWARADERGEKAAKEEAKKLDGTWVPTEMELGGQKLPEAVVQSIKLVISGDHYAVTTNEGKDEGTSRLHPDKSPKAMDITGTEGPNKGKTFLAIYELDGDKLKVCYDLSGKERPKEFKTQPNTQQFLAVYKKQKD